jgi:aldehyde dehydrogenase (NAD+)
MGGGIPSHQGFCVEPTVLVDADPRATVAQEENFGPVLVEIANDSVYGLSGAVQSASLERARAVANKMSTVRWP